MGSPTTAQRRPVPANALALLAAAADGLHDATRCEVATDRYAAAHLAALRAAAAVLAVRARPDGRRGRPQNAWTVLAVVAPELAEWANFFAAGARKRAAAEAGLRSAATAREADDLVRDAECFVRLVETTLGVLPHDVDVRRQSAWAG